TPPGTPHWGKGWKQATAKWYRRWFNVDGTACNYAYRDNYLDLDPTYKDVLGRPLIRMTFNFKDNERHHRDAAALPQRRLRRAALSVHAQHRRHDHGGRSLDQRGEQISAGLGRQQSLHHGCIHLPAEPELQPDGTARRAGLLVGQCDH